MICEQDPDSFPELRRHLINQLMALPSTRRLRPRPTHGGKMRPFQPLALAGEQVTDSVTGEVIATVKVNLDSGRKLDPDDFTWNIEPPKRETPVLPSNWLRWVTIPWGGLACDLHLARGWMSETDPPPPAGKPRQEGAGVVVIGTAR